MAERKKQHIIPRCYLKAWCDPRTPAGQHPFIWRISRNGTEKKRKSPEKSFTATDKYTIKLPSGKRNLIIESTLSSTENDFANVLSRVRRREKLNLMDRARLCLFAAAMHTRTTAMGEHWKRQYQELNDTVAALEQAHGAAPTTSLATAKMVAHAHQHIIAMGLALEAPLLFQMQMTILVANDEIGFITSDNPCVWFNPMLHRFPPFYRSPGLAQPDVEVTLPLTPEHLLLISHRAWPLYIDVGQKAVDESNRLRRFYCWEEFISWKGETRPCWFDPGKEPEDTWEKTEGKRYLEERDRILREMTEGQKQKEAGLDDSSGDADPSENTPE